MGSNGGEVETLRCFRWAAYVADEGVLMVGTLEMRNVRAYQGSNKGSGLGHDGLKSKSHNNMAHFHCSSSV